ncbi:MAG: hypothetical protein ACRDHY_17940 [Anaerolineales bacterium]
MLALVGLFFLLLAVGVLVGTGFAAADRLVLGAGGSLAAVLLVIGALASLRMARSHPRLRVESDAFTLEHPGLLRLPLVVPRNEVTEICTGDPLAREGKREGEGRSGGGRGSTPPIFPSSGILPNFSRPLRSSGRPPDVLVVLRDRLDLDGLPRRGLWAVAFFADRFGSYEGPARGGVIRGLVFDAERLDEVARLFAPWGVMVGEPSEAARARLAPGRRTGGRSGADGVPT